MKLIKNKYLPTFVLIDGECKHWMKLTSEEKKHVFIHGRSEYSINQRPLFKRLIEESEYSIMKYGGGFTEKEFIDICNKTKVSGKFVQPLLKEAHGGGRGATSWGVVHIAKENLIEKYLKEMDILEEFLKLPKSKQVNRIHKFIGQYNDFPVKPRVKLGLPYPLEGLIFATPSFMKKCNIPFGTKTTGPTKGLIIPTTVDSDEWDIVIPENENKLKLSEEKLSNNMKLNLQLIPQNLFSRNLKRRFSKEVGRNPSEGLDMASILGRMPKKEWLEEARSIYEGRATKEVIVKTLFTYENQKGEEVCNIYGTRVLAGESIFKEDLWPHADKALMTMIKKAIQPRIEGIYGVIMPIDLLKYYKANSKKMVGWLTRFPWTLPILTEVKVWNNCIFVDNDLWQCFGGDYDGDQGAVFGKYVMKGHLSWKHDRKWIQQHMSLPEKVDNAKDIRSIEEVIGCILGQYSGCGRTFNAAKIVVDSARRAGWNRKQILELEIKLQVNEVQPYIDGLKYMHADAEVKTPLMLAKECGVPTDYIKVDMMYFTPLRGRSAGVDDLVSIGKLASENSLAFYERIISYFKDWEKGTISNPDIIPDKVSVLDNTVKSIVNQSILDNHITNNDAIKSVMAQVI